MPLHKRLSILMPVGDIMIKVDVRGHFLQRPHILFSIRSWSESRIIWSGFSSRLLGNFSFPSFIRFSYLSLAEPMSNKYATLFNDPWNAFFEVVTMFASLVWREFIETKYCLPSSIEFESCKRLTYSTSIRMISTVESNVATTKCWGAGNTPSTRRAYVFKNMAFTFWELRRIYTTDTISEYRTACVWLDKLCCT